MGEEVDAPFQVPTMCCALAVIAQMHAIALCPSR